MSLSEYRVVAGDAPLNRTATVEEAGRAAVYPAASPGITGSIELTGGAMAD